MPVVRTSDVLAVPIQFRRALLHERPILRVFVSLLDVWAVWDQLACFVEQDHSIIKLLFVNSQESQAGNGVSIIGRLIEHLLKFRLRVRQSLLAHLRLRDAEHSLLVPRM